MLIEGLVSWLITLIITTPITINQAIRYSPKLSYIKLTSGGPAIIPNDDTLIEKPIIAPRLLVPKDSFNITECRVILPPQPMPNSIIAGRRVHRDIVVMLLKSIRLSPTSVVPEAAINFLLNLSPNHPKLRRPIILNIASALVIKLDAILSLPIVDKKGII